MGSKSTPINQRGVSAFAHDEKLVSVIDNEISESYADITLDALIAAMQLARQNAGSGSWSFAMGREYVERVEHKDFVLARWQEPVNGATAQYRWDIINPLGQVVTTVTDREHAESYVDNHLENK